MSEAAATADLARSGISEYDAGRAGVGYAENAKLVDLGFERVPALVLPYLHPLTGEPLRCRGSQKPFVRVRYLEDVYDEDGKLVRYSQPKRSGVRAYFPPVIDWAGVFADPTWPVVITEGEKKALALCLQGVACIGIGGVWNWREEDESLLEELVELGWRDRQAVICYDSDAESNPQVRFAELALAAELQRRGARPHICRLEPSADGGKRGVDDYIAAGRTTQLLQLIEEAGYITSLDEAVLALNAEVAYIESEDCVYVLSDDRRISKSAFCQGSRWSSLRVAIPRSVKGKIVEAEQSLAPLWLKHPAARRYADTVFDPGAKAAEVMGDNGLRLNRWRGFKSTKGDVQPFLDLTDHLLSKTPANASDLVLKLFAYKAQNPALKIPLALALIGPQGCGKSAWAKIMARAFAPYGASIPSAALKADFQEWAETSLVVVIDEAQSAHTIGAKDQLKSFISEQRMRVNTKHISAKQVRNYSQFILTSNDRRTGAYDRDDRRMIVVDCPAPREKAFYESLHQWADNGGTEALMGWLLSYDLQGWTPPQAAPLTTEKVMAFQESLTPIQKLADDMLTADENVVKRWLDSAMAWARVAQGSQVAAEAKQAKETMAIANTMPIRPFYTPDELALMFPAIVGTLHGARKLDGTASGIISRELRNAGIGYLQPKDDPRGFQWRGAWRQYLVIAAPKEWAEPVSQAEFERYMKNCPVYRA